MTCMKKLTALLVSAALALSLLAGCGGSKALSQVIADLLSGQYNNVTVEVDPALTAALKKAAAAGDTQEEVLAALVENLSLSGGSITFNNLGDGQQGQHGVTLTFQPGSDPEAAARSAFTEWNRVFSSLPDDGSYRAHVSMIEAEGGYYIAVDVEVLKAGSHDKDEPDDNDEDEDDEPAPSKDPYTKVDDQNYTINTSEGLQKLVEDLNWPKANTILSVNITLNCDVTLDDTWIPIGTEQNPYTGTFDGQEHTIDGLNVSGNYEYAGLFGYIQGGTVKNLTLNSPKVTSTYEDDSGDGIGTPISPGCIGGVAGFNDGFIENCHVEGGSVHSTISACNAGGVVGQNGGDVTGCYTTCSVILKDKDDNFAGGVVGWNNGGSVTACCSTSSVSGYNAGGVVGSNSGTVTACYHANGSVSGNRAGGVVGYNLTFSFGGTVFGGTVTACYWSGTGPTCGIGWPESDINATKVDGSTVEWTESVGETLSAMDAMNEALKGGDWQYLDNTASGNPPLTLKKTG
ncbi:GLUG motif-containing protein [Faecalibacterium sp. An192]|uniref:GLUG motif-containing protein n=1 Tax=Faecalibacterium sp. An192 TaxID=1965581 RepID=UPI000B385B14|nr:GLUG motif-containing protein [Faecalibacterium sp. An192]OUP29063.1 hypothetical protein B5F27_04625 [Faecalibacterium sp. An192]